ncbi:DGQHR domain-containing protein [Clostridium botulinum]|nr:DGQHR domain-containing protein [Clostridium botulinum]NFM02671.1 DGQHR domain-containing protein [Clostridium botulinum]
MIKNVEFIKFKQNQYTFYMINMNINDIINNYTIDLYDSRENPMGYQRPIQVSHRRKLVEYLTLTEEPLLNTSIIVAIPYNCLEESYNKLTIKSNMKIVDGQHRIEAFKELKLKNNELFTSKFKNFYIPIIIIPGEEDKILEIETFININNKNKRVSTALAVQILQRIRENRDQDIFGEVVLSSLSDGKFNELVKSISYKVTSALNSDPNSLWFELIRTGDTNTKNRVISINAFSNSLEVIIKRYLTISKYDRFNTDEIEMKIKLIILNTWDIVKRKWNEAFDIKYYNIQKGIGVYSIHNILASCIESEEMIFMDKFTNVIEESKVTYNDWMIGGKFSPFNSKAGIKRIEAYIKGDETI